LLGAPLGIAAAAALDAPLAFAAVSVASFAWMLALILSTLATPRGIHDRISRSAVVREPPGRR
jgi:uncharacterized RDD family membrane protein YckC